MSLSVLPWQSTRASVSPDRSLREGEAPAVRPFLNSALQLIQRTPTPPRSSASVTTWSVVIATVTELMPPPVGSHAVTATAAPTAATDKSVRLRLA
ncbi:hypothetical protein [Streptomyces sp. 11-1-2]|uniref:hypothetical protein n=1 Tax=unclassified Streptomyces TaxID=2593676 RepID=UPI0013C52037|nr:hypothetical protein [Streptomyces sp. 11-1-2]